MERRESSLMDSPKFRTTLPGGLFIALGNRHPIERDKCIAETPMIGPPLIASARCIEGKLEFEAISYTAATFGSVLDTSFDRLS